MKINLKEIVTVDYETFYSTACGFSAKAHNTSSYVRAPEFHVHCVAIKEGTKPAKCYTREAGLKKLMSIDWANRDLLCHNTAFDGAIMAWHQGVPKPRRYLDTLSMSRAVASDFANNLNEMGKLYGLGEKLQQGVSLTAVKGLKTEEIPPLLMQPLMDYCARDTDLCFDIFCHQIQAFPEAEIDLIDLTLRMFIDPVFKLDVERCERALDAEIQDRQMGIALGVHYGGLDSEKDLTSNNKFAAALEKFGVEVPMKRSKTTGEMTYALAVGDEEFQALLNHDDIRVVRLVQGRIAAKSTIGETRAARLLQAGFNSQYIPVLLNYYGAKTGRWSGGNKLNFQNFPRGGELRKSIIAPDQHVIVPCDSAQIEARVLAWLSGNDAITAVFANGEDVYSHTASGIYGKPINKNDHPDERFVGKVATLGLGYGMGAQKFQTTLALGSMGPAVQKGLNECNTIVKKFRNSNAAYPALWKQMDVILSNIAAGVEGTYKCISYDGDGIWLPNGLGIMYPHIHRINEEGKGMSYQYFSKGMKKKLYGGLVTENVIQALAGVVIREQMLHTKTYLSSLALKVGEVAKIATMTHDEIVVVVPERLAKKVLKDMIKLMSTPPSWAKGLPLGADGGYSREYSK